MTRNLGRTLTERVVHMDRSLLIQSLRQEIDDIGCIRGTDRRQPNVRSCRDLYWLQSFDKPSVRNSVHSGSHQRSGVPEA